MDLLAGQAQHAPKICLAAVASEVRPEDSAKFIPKRGFSAGPEGGVHPRPPPADTISFYSVLKHLLAGLEEKLGDVGVKPELGVKWG